MCSLFELLTFLFFLVFKVIHSDYLGKFVQARNPVTRGGRCADGRQIPQSLYDQLRQGESFRGYPPREHDSQTCNQSISLFFPFRLDFLQKTIAPAAHTHGLTLTATATLILSLIVSLVNLHKCKFSVTDCPLLYLYFTAFRAQQGDVVRGACRIAPQDAFQIAAEWLQYQITIPIDTGGSKSKYIKLDLSENHSIRE